MQEQKNISLDAYIADVRARRELAITRQPTFTANRGARLLARRVAKSLKHVQILVGQKLPSNQDIADYEKEAAQLLHDGYLGAVTYGWRKEGCWVFTFQYEAAEAGNITEGEPEERLFPRLFAGGMFVSYLAYSKKWAQDLPTEADREKYKQEHLPFIRIAAEMPAAEWESDNGEYKINGIAIRRNRLKRGT